MDCCHVSGVYSECSRSPFVFIHAIEGQHRFYEDRQLEAVTTHSVWTSQYYRDVERYAENPFWAVRRGVPAFHLTPIVRFPEPPRAPQFTTRVRLAPEVSLIEEPCVVGETIDIRLALRSPALARPLVFLDGIEIAPLLGHVSKFPTWGELLSQWSERLPLWRAARLATWLWEKRVLCEALSIYSVIPELGCLKVASRAQFSCPGFGPR
jgi:hypothetical protein